MDRYEFIWKAIQKHGYKYDYKKVAYKNNKTKVCIICPEHGEFWQVPNNHLHGYGCSLCGYELTSIKTKDSLCDFVEKAKKIHDNKYDYSKVSYVNSKTKICVICPEHGEFWQTPNIHLSNHGCVKCYDKIRNLSNKSNTKDFIEKAKKVHGDKYDYSKTNYISVFEKIVIVCPKHGEFKQRPNDHLCGKGCMVCSSSKLELQIKKALDNNNLKYIFQAKFKWLGKLSLDFYLPYYNIAIECQGEQHFIPVDFGNKGEEYAKKQFIKIQQRDKIKYDKCLSNKINVLYYTNNIVYGLDKYIDTVYTNENDVITTITESQPIINEC